MNRIIGLGLRLVKDYSTAFEASALAQEHCLAAAFTMIGVIKCHIFDLLHDTNKRILFIALTVLADRQLQSHLGTHYKTVRPVSAVNTSGRSGL